MLDCYENSSNQNRRHARIPLERDSVAAQRDGRVRPPSLEFPNESPLSRGRGFRVLAVDKHVCGSDDNAGVLSELRNVSS